MDNKINITVLAKDLASKVLKNVKVSAGGLQKNLRGGFTKAFNVAKVGALAFVGALGLVATGIFKLAKRGSDFIELRDKADAVFRKQLPDIQKWSKTLARETNRSSGEILAFATAFQDTFVPMGFARKQASKLSKDLSKLTLDVAAFNNASEEEVQRNFNSALVGNHEAVRSYGIVITQARLSQELMNMGIKDGVKNATEQQKVMARMNLLMSDTSDAHGNAAKTADTFEGRMRGIRASVKDATTSFAVHVQEALIPFLGNLQNVISSIADFVEKNKLGEKAGVLLGKTIRGLSKALQNAIKWFQENRGEIKKWLERGKEFAMFIKDQLIKTWQDLVFIFGSNKNVIIAILGAIGIAAVIAFGPMLLIMLKVTLVIGAIMVALRLLKKPLKFIVDFFKDKFTRIKTDFNNAQGAGRKFGVVVKGAFELMMAPINIVKRALERIVGLFTKAKNKSKGFSGSTSNLGDIARRNLAPKEAMGSRFFKGGVAMVGERGRELVNLPKGSQIMSNPQTEAMMGKKEVNITNNFTRHVNPDIVASKLAFQINLA